MADVLPISPYISLTIKLQAYYYEIIHWDDTVHHSADYLFHLTPVFLGPPMADNLYEKLLEDLSLWGEELLKVKN
ncbi:hypothetical protein DSO57_1003968 [Entomophthora muscae]|uniref:Uncharacterized protein n=1 Tax=Entomophthora muscae TaxID=34485 RepID=A0ACC2TVQ5_9FUNG|nr:hypothetical protein DSO57_1003968 [Entomophthora muscae]